MSDKNNSGEGENAAGDTKPKERSGFYTTLLKHLDEIVVGETVIIIKEIKKSGVIICILAPKDQKILKKRGING